MSEAYASQKQHVDDKNKSHKSKADALKIVVTNQTLAQEGQLEETEYLHMMMRGTGITTWTNDGYGVSGTSSNY